MRNRVLSRWGVILPREKSKRSDIGGEEDGRRPFYQLKEASNKKVKIEGQLPKRNSLPGESPVKKDEKYFKKDDDRKKDRHDIKREKHESDKKKDRHERDKKKD